MVRENSEGDLPDRQVDRAIDPLDNKAINNLMLMRCIIVKMNHTLLSFRNLDSNLVVARSLKGQNLKGRSLKGMRHYNNLNSCRI